jgi:hypothetical protein
MKRKNQNRHHLIPKSRRHNYKIKQPIFITLWLHVERHFYWHKVFGNHTLDEVITILQRIRRHKFGSELVLPEANDPPY